MKELITKHGGPTAVSKKSPVPLRTLEDWKAGRGPRSDWAKPLLSHWLENPPKELKMSEEYDFPPLECIKCDWAGDYNDLDLSKDKCPSCGSEVICSE